MPSWIKARAPRHRGQILNELVEDLVPLAKIRSDHHLLPCFDSCRYADQMIDSVGQLPRGFIGQVSLGHLLQSKFGIQRDGLRRAKPTIWHERDARRGMAQERATLSEFYSEKVIDLLIHHTVFMCRRIAQLTVPSARETATSPSERNSTRWSSLDAINPRRRQNSAAPSSTALTIKARPPTRLAA